jgi:hypothetical protein
MSLGGSLISDLENISSKEGFVLDCLSIKILPVNLLPENISSKLGLGIITILLI